MVRIQLYLKLLINYIKNYTYWGKKVIFDKNILNKEKKIDKKFDKKNLKEFFFENYENFLYKLNYINFNKNLKKKIIIRNKFTIFFSKSNLHLSIISKKLIYGISIGKYMSLIGSSKAIWKKKNNRYKKLIFDFIYKLIFFTKIQFMYIFVKNIKNTFFLFLKYLKKIKYNNIVIKDTVNYTKVKSKKKTYIKRRISRKLNYLNPLKI